MHPTYSHVSGETNQPVAMNHIMMNVFTFSIQLCILLNLTLDAITKTPKLFSFKQQESRGNASNHRANHLLDLLRANMETMR